MNVLQTPDPLPAATWSHVTVTRQRGSVAILVDGKSVISQDIPASFNDPGRTYGSHMHPLAI